jgi:chemotaxis protein MotB
MAEGSEELVIIRRRSAFNEAEFKSGVWKIAYADFMTAMMAFFLVLWLLNATNQETRESVASYFNPIKLSESTPDRKGVNDPQKAQPEKSETDPTTSKPADAGPVAPPPPPAALPTPPNKSGPGSGQPVDSSVAKPPRFDEAALFRDPYAVLTDIAGGPASTAKRERRIGISLGSPDRQGSKDGEAYRDPFDPIYWQIAPKASIERRNSGPGERGSLPADEDLAALIDGEARKPPDGQLDVTVTTSGYQPDSTGPAAEKPVHDAPAAAPASRAPGVTLVQQTVATQTPPPQPATATSKAALTVPPEPAGEPADAHRPASPPIDKAFSEKPAADTAANAAADPAAALEAAVRAAVANGPHPGPAVAVERTDEGLLISLTDSATFGMFAIGSAEPQPELVRTIDRIGPALSGHKDAIVIRGHTDARPFRSQTYDNWRLSTARAHMAYHMLVRAGIDSARIERIEGYADRRLKQPGNPFAAPNRRIEILIKGRRP